MDNRIGLNKGIRLAPSIGDDGELTECINLTPDDGGLRNIPKPETIIEAGGHDLLAVHVIPETGEKHFIVGSRHAAEEDTRGRRWESIEQIQDEDNPWPADETEYTVKIWRNSTPPTAADFLLLRTREILVWAENDVTYEQQGGDSPWGTPITIPIYDENTTSSLHAARAEGATGVVKIGVTCSVLQDEQSWNLPIESLELTFEASAQTVTTERTGTPVIETVMTATVVEESISNVRSIEKETEAEQEEILPYRLSYYKYNGTRWVHDEHYFCSFEDKPKEVKAIGNTLVILSDTGVEYARWKRDKYISLGSQPEETKIAFSLSGENVVLDAHRDYETGKVLWLTVWTPSGDSGTWGTPIKASNETIAAGNKIVIFKSCGLAIPSEIPRPDAGDTSSLPAGWKDTPTRDVRYSLKEFFNMVWAFCVGTVNQDGQTVSWGEKVGLVSSSWFTGIPWSETKGAMMLGDNNVTPTISNDELNKKAIPTGWSRLATLRAATSPMYITLEEDNKDYYAGEIIKLEAHNVSSIAIQDNDLESASNGVMGAVARWMEMATEKNRFCYPFFVRYAYRMADGSHTMHSAPILMIPNSIGQPVVCCEKTIPSESGRCNLLIYTGGPQVSLEINKLSVPKSIEDWSDIITGIDIFVTQQFYGYNPTGKIKTISPLTAEQNGAYSVSYNLQWMNSAGNEPDKKYRKFQWVNNRSFSGSGMATLLENEPWVVDLPSRDMWDEDAVTLSTAEKKSYDNQIEQENKFYLLKSFALMATEGTTGADKDVIHVGGMEIDSGRLGTLTVQDTLKDDFYSHDKRIASMAFAYNNRLNLAGIQREAFNGFAPNYIPCYREIVEASVDDNEKWSVKAIFTHIKGAEGDIIVKANKERWGVEGEEDAEVYFPEWFFYPNPKAFKMTICLSREATGYYEYQEREILLREHSGLNGAYWFLGFMNVKKLGTRVFYIKTSQEYSGTNVTVSTDNITTLPHSLYQSRVDNPFQFESDGVSEVGSGEIMAVSVVTKSLSPGQRGRSPMYVFSSDGIWDLVMNKEGQWETVNPVSNDVCTNARSVVAVEDAVLFGTEQGLKLLQGETTVLLSEVMDGHSSRMVLNNGDDAASYMYDAMNVQTNPYYELAPAIAPFRQTSGMADTPLVLKDVLRECIGTYDYASRLVHLYASGAKHYVYSLQSREFSSAIDRVVKTMVQGYPESYVQYENGDIAVYGVQDKENATLRPGFLVTRPIGFGDAMGMKILRDMRLMYRKTVVDTEQNGTPRLGTRCVVAKFVSNDRLHWLPLTSLHRHSYKWYRFAIFTWMADGDVLEGMVCRTDEARGDRLR